MIWKKWIWFFLLFFPHPAWSMTIAVVDHGSDHQRPCQKLRVLIQKELSHNLPHRDLVVVTPTRAEFAQHLDLVLKQELAEAWEAYFRLDFSRAAQRLQGRNDADALALQALLAHGAGKEQKVRALLTSALWEDPHYRLDPKEFPPQLVKIFQELVASSHSSGKKLPRNFLDLSGWETRLLQVKKQAGWDELLLIGLESIGWNFKTTATRLEDRLEKTYLVELKDLNTLPEAARILVKKSYLIDTPRDIE